MPLPTLRKVLSNFIHLGKSDTLGIKGTIAQIIIESKEKISLAKTGLFLNLLIRKIKVLKRFLYCISI